MPTSSKTHADGTHCLEGTKRVPRPFQPCCTVFAGHVATCAHDVRYEWWPKVARWVIAIAESTGGGGIEISFCPHCGTRLRPPARKAGSARGQVKLAPDFDAVPADFEGYLK